jgi:chromosome segregation ATPase
VFEHLKEHLLAELAGAHTAAEQASAARDQAQAEHDQLVEQLPPLQDGLSQAQASAQQAHDQLAAAQAIVDQRRQARDDAQAALANPRQALADHEANEPERFDERHHLNPEWLDWQERRDELIGAVRDAQAALDNANNLLAQAQQARDGAAEHATQATAAATAAQEQLDAATERVTTAQRRVDAATAAINDAEQAAAGLGEQLSKLDARTARILAEPLDRTDLEHAADAELADLLAALTHQHATLARRAAAVTARTAVLESADHTVEELAALGRDIAALQQKTVGWPSFVPLLAAIDEAVRANAAQRGQPPVDRHDDLAGLHTVLMVRFADVLEDIAAAKAARDRAADARTRAAQALASHQQETN